MHNAAQQRASTAKTAFTLIELSIVLVVIGLIVAGLLSGKSLVKQAKIRAQINQIQKYEMAFNAFVLQYDAVPGDMSNAQTFWAAATNGDGNLRIEYPSGQPSADIAIGGEKINFFRHLALAGIINETYTGTADLPGVNLPAIAYNNKYSLIAASYYMWPDFPISQAYLAMVVCRPGEVIPGSTADSAFNDCSIFVPADLRAMDSKMDDGVYNSGKMSGALSCCGGGAWSFSCVTGSGEYDLSNAQPGCLAMYRLRK